MLQSNKLCFFSTVLLLILMVVSAYFQWSIAITVVACISLIAINIHERYQSNIKIKKYQTLFDELNNDIEVSVSEMFVELETTFNTERRIIDNEIQRTTDLLTEAVIGMNDSFQQMKKINDKQHHLLSELLQNSQDSTTAEQSIHQFLNESSAVVNDTINELSNQIVTNPSLNSVNIEQVVEKQATANLITQKMKSISYTMENNIVSLSSMSHEMDNAMYHAVISLQFEDMTSQALASISNNIEQFDNISQQMNEISQSDVPIVAKLNQIKMACQLISEQSNDIGSKRSVSQVSMEEGEIELF